MSDEKKIDEISGTETTGHEWDGIEELNTPMPRWWLYIFYASILFAVIYAVLMPAIPGLPGVGDHTRGVLDYSDRAQVIEDLEQLDSNRSGMMSRLTNASLETIQGDDELFNYALAAGKSAFGDNCATCHGSGAQGFKGYPNLNDDDWLWGGTFEDIRKTLTVGIRAEHDDTRFGLMQAYGNGFLQKDQIDDLVQHVVSLSAEPSDALSALRGAELYKLNCVSCHQSDGSGDRMQGAPNLTDAVWLFGDSEADIRETITYGRQGVMPNWNERLSPEMITALSVYVHSLGGGEDTPRAE